MRGAHADAIPARTIVNDHGIAESLRELLAGDACYGVRAASGRVRVASNESRRVNRVIRMIGGVESPGQPSDEA